MRRSKPSYANESGTGAPRPSLQARLRRCMLALSLLLGAAATAPALAAPITGENQPGPSGDSADAPGLPAPPDAAAPSLAAAAFGDDANAMVIEFSVMPSADDPTKMETVVILQRGGGRRICVNLKSTDVIVRSYRKRGDEPFAPAVPGNIRGLTSGDSGSLIDFNETSVFIRPHTIDDTFTSQDECFIAGEAEGCFLPDEAEDCDQRLEEGEVACVVATISRAGCSLLDHASLSRQLRILVALNQPPGVVPIITEAGIAQAPEVIVAPEAPSADLPTGPAPAGPTAEAPPSGSGGGEDLVIVPNIVGFPVPASIRMVTDAGLTVGTVVVTTQFSALDNLFISSAWAFECLPAPEACERSDAITDNQCLEAGISVLRGTVMCFTGLILIPPDIPEPPSLALFATGLGLLILMTWWRRRRRG